MSDIVHGKAVRLTDRVRRITAANPGIMTGPGTNSYLVGEQAIAVIDPGPAQQAHIDAILDACGDKLRWILATHSHLDHSPAAQILSDATGAVVLGNKLANDDGFQDVSFNPSQSFAHDQCLCTQEFTIRALCTPGHVGNHLCYLIEEDGLLLTGDHIMQGSTVVIVPPHGDMKDYIASLRLLLNYPLSALGPGHGDVIHDPRREIEALIEHRLGREAKVLQVLEQYRRASLDFLTPLVYDDVDAVLHPIARYSLLAHLIKLEKERRLVAEGEYWRIL